MNARPVDLRAVFPDATRSCGSNSGWYAVHPPDVVPHAVPASCPVVRASSLGIVQRSPLRRIARQGVHSRRCTRTVARSRDLLRDATATSHPRSDLVVLHHLAGFLLPVGTRMLQRVSDHGVHHVSADTAGCPVLANRPFPRHRAFPWCLPALRSLPSVHSGWSPPHEGFSGRSVTTSTVTRRSVHRPPCPLAVAALPSWEVTFPFLEPRLGLKAFLRARVRCFPRPLPAAGNPVLPWA